MVGLFIFASASSAIRFATLTNNSNDDDHFFGETTVTTDYLFAGATTTARWLFSFKLWQVCYEGPKLFEKAKIKRRSYKCINTGIIALINIPWLFLSCCQKKSYLLVQGLQVTSTLEYSTRLLLIIMLMDCFRRLCTLHRKVPILKVKTGKLCQLAGLILLWFAQWSLQTA